MADKSAYLCRLEVCVGYTKMLEAVVPAGMDRDLWHTWCDIRYRRGLPMGGAVMHRADQPRAWDVPVGGTIPGGDTYVSEEVNVDYLADMGVRPQSV